jgi:DNA-binding GntR family transcriptional regulator
MQSNGSALRASEHAYEQLRDLIVDLRLEPGTMIDEQSMAARLGFGRTPVREAVARLAGDQLVVILPRRGAMISPIGIDTVRSIFDAREVIECGIAELAARYATDADLQHFRGLVEQAEGARDPTRLGQFLDDDQQIHRFLMRLVRNSFLERAADRILVHNLRLWRYYFSTHPPQIETMISHAPLLAALERRDQEGARQAMFEHIRASRGLLNGLFR